MTPPLKHDPRTRSATAETDPEELVVDRLRLFRWQLEVLTAQAKVTGASRAAYLRALLSKVLRKETKIQ